MVNRKELLKIVVLLLVATAGWLQTLHAWADASAPNAVSGLLMILGTTLGAAFGVSTHKGGDR